MRNVLTILFVSSQEVQHYATIEKEALGLIWDLQHFDVYVGGCAIPVVYIQIITN